MANHEQWSIRLGRIVGVILASALVVMILTAIFGLLALFVYWILVIIGVIS